MRARRRAVRQGAQHERTARRTTLGPIPYPEETVSRFLLWGAVALAALIIVLLSAGWYSSFYSPPRAIVGQVGGTEITLGDVIPYTLIEAIENGQFTPAGALNNMARDELLRQGAGELGLSVTEADVEAELASRFEPPSSNPDNPEPTALTSAGEANLDRYLADAQTNGVGVSEEQYRRWLEGQLLTAQAITHFNDALPDTLEQVRLRWIVAANSADADTALQRLAAEEPFADVAADLNTDTTLADEGEAFQVGLPTGPLQTSLGTLVIEVTEGPAEQPLSPAMRSLRGLNDLDEWLEQQTSLLLERLRLSNDQIEWVYKRLGVV